MTSMFYKHSVLVWNVKLNWILVAAAAAPRLRHTSDTRPEQARSVSSPTVSNSWLAEANEGVGPNLLFIMPSPTLVEALLSRLDKLPPSDASIKSPLMGKCNDVG